LGTPPQYTRAHHSASSAACDFASDAEETEGDGDADEEAADER